MTSQRFLRPGRARRAGFTLLEVLVAIAILGLGLTIILSSQTGLFSSSLHTSNLSIATGLVRCKMSEIEIKLLQEGLPLMDQTEEGHCCEEESTEGFTCNWKIERIELPLTQDANLFGDGGAPSPSGQASAEGMGTTGTGTSSSTGGGFGPFSALASIEKSKGAVLGSSPDLGSVSDLMGGAAMGGSMAMAPLVMSIVYPDLKTMFEASIRKVSATVAWHEGSQDQELTVVQFIANPTQGGFDPNAAAGLTEVLESNANSGSGTGKGSGGKP
jgi:general secretion pathway protein I